jgi:hypothetical protein
LVASSFEGGFRHARRFAFYLSFLSNRLLIFLAISANIL